MGNVLILYETLKFLRTKIPSANFLSALCLPASVFRLFLQHLGSIESWET